MFKYKYLDVYPSLSKFWKKQNRNSVLFMEAIMNKFLDNEAISLIYNGDHLYFHH